MFSQHLKQTCAVSFYFWSEYGEQNVHVLYSEILT